MPMIGTISTALFQPRECCVRVAAALLTPTHQHVGVYTCPSYGQGCTCAAQTLSMMPAPVEVLSMAMKTEHTHSAVL
jgi:hypothetical protein